MLSSPTQSFSRGLATTAQGLDSRMAVARSQVARLRFPPREDWHSAVRSYVTRIGQRLALLRLHPTNTFVLLRRRFGIRWSRNSEDRPVAGLE